MVSPYKQRAIDAYDEYMVFQAQIDRIEEQALKVLQSRPLAEYQLKNMEEYRHLCALRDMKMKVASLNAQMALL